MKITAKAILIALAASATAFAGAATTVAPNPCPEEVTSSGIYDGNLFAPEDGDPAYKIAANEKYGFQFAGDMAVGYWNNNNGMDSSADNSTYYLFHGQAAKNLIKDNVNGGLWFRTELSISVALDRDSRHDEADFNGAAGSITAPHADIMGPNNVAIPEMLLTQYYNKKKLAVSFGMVNLTNYFDAVGIANDSFGSFTNSGLVNSTILPLVDSNLGTVVQYQINDDNYAMVAASRTCTETGYNPFRSGRGYALVGEYGYTFADGDATLRVNPFMDAQEGDAGYDYNVGLVASIEYALNDNVTVYARAGFSGDDNLGNGAELSFGTHIRPFSSREDDFVGIAYCFTKPAGCDDDSEIGSSENVLEVIYSLQLTDTVKLVPHFQYIHGAADQAAKQDQCIFGVQTVYSF
ncbi:MAG: carbohydrate porin [Akkermansia sp.]